MKQLKDFILLETEAQKYHYDKTNSSNIVVFDTENACFTRFFKDLKGAQKFADDFDRISNATKKVIKSSKNLRFIVIDFNNLSKEAQECMNSYKEVFDEFCKKHNIKI